MLRWIYERFAFWDLACYACGSRDGWHTSLCGWRSNSYIAIAACRQCGAEQFLKKYRPQGNASRWMAQREYDVLQHLAGGTGSKPPILLPRAYNFAATTCALSMEYIPGVTMDERMRKALDKEDFHDCLRVSAVWLQGLHGIPAKHGTAGNDYEAILRQLELDCKPLASRSVMVSHALTYMRSSLDKISDLLLERVPLHGDFKASNLIWTPKGVYGIDVGLHFKNPAMMDAAQFIVNVLLNRPSIPAIAGERDTALVVDVFLEAYGDNRLSTRKLTAWLLLCFLLSRWQGDTESWKLSMFVDRIYAATLADVMAFCDKNNFAQMGKGKLADYRARSTTRMS